MMKRKFAVTGLVAVAALALVAAACTGGAAPTPTDPQDGSAGGTVLSLGKITKELSDALDAARADIDARFGVDAEKVILLNSEDREWPDTSLGLPEPDMVYAQVITPGFKLSLFAGGKQYEYHSDSSGTNVKFAGIGELPDGFDPQGIAF